MIIKARSYPRAGLLGNPSDGYFGRTISFTFNNFWAEVELYESPDLVIYPNERDRSIFKSVSEIVQDVKLFGYYGGIRLLKATIKRFVDYCHANGLLIDKRRFSIRYKVNIPHQVGLAGSSAIITAAFRALMAFYQVDIHKPVLANLILSVEKDELKITAGLQDRVAQVYEGCVYMDFNERLLEKQGFGDYQALDPGLLPNLYIAYRTDLSEVSDVFHNNIRERFDRGEKRVTQAMRSLARLTEKGREHLLKGRKEALGPLIDRNFDLRCGMYKISRENREMVMAARSVGASAKFTGSGGAIVGTYKNERMYVKLKERLKPQKIKVIKPSIAVSRRA